MVLGAVLLFLSEPCVGQKLGCISVCVCFWTQGCVFSAAHRRASTLILWCRFEAMASQTISRQVEFGSLRCSASIFLALVGASLGHGYEGKPWRHHGRSC